MVCAVPGFGLAGLNMPSGSRVCPHCGRLNSADDKTCFICKKRFPGPVSAAVGGLLGDFSADAAPATKLIVLLCILNYVAMMVSDGPLHLELSVVGNFRLSSMLRFGALFGELAYSEPFRLLSAVFVHLGLFHIVMNMLALVGLGREVEQAFGSARFVILYIATGILGFVASQWWYGFSPPTAGASGAVFGLLGARVGQLWGKRDPTWRRHLVNYAVGALIWNFVMPMNTAAHLGGFFAGVVAAALFEREKQPRSRQRLMAAVAGFGLLASVASVLLSIRSPVWKEVRQHEDARAERAERRRLESE